MSAPEGDEEKGSPPASSAGGPSATGEGSKPSVGQSALVGTLALGCCCCAVVLVFFVSILLAIWDVFTTVRKQLEPEDFEYGGWATVSDVSECSGVVRNAFKNGGNLADAAVATLICMGVAAPHLMGIGGGFIALHYDQKTDKVRALNALGKAPASIGVLTPAEMKRGFKAAIVPGALRGYETLHKDLKGKLSWQKLFAPAINLANEGFPIKKHFAAILKSHESEISASPDLKAIFKDVTKEGDKLVQKELGKTLTDISNGDATVFYTNNADALTSNAAITSADLSDYKAVWTDAVAQDTFENDQFFSAPFPSSGMLLIPGIGVPNVTFTDDHRANTKDARQASDKVQELKKQMKHVLEVIPLLQDGSQDPGFPDLVKKIKDGISSKKDAAAPSHPVVQDYGGVHLSIVNEEGALSIVSGLNEPFGSKKAPVAGIIMNNYNNAFAKKADAGGDTPNELLDGGKQPRTSLNPIMAKRKNEKRIRLVAGAAGGLKGMWALAQVLTCITVSQASSCVRQAERIAPEIKDTDSVMDIQPTASGIFAKSPFVSWLAPSDNEHCDGSSDGMKVTLKDKLGTYNKISAS